TISAISRRHPKQNTSSSGACTAASASERECKQWWADAAHEMRQDALSVVEWTSTTWPVLHLLGHVAVAVAEEGGIRPATILTVTPTGPCCAGRLRTDVFGEGTNEGIRAIFGTTLSKPFDTSCPAGFQWVATVKMSLCARLEVKCARGTACRRDAPRRWRSRSASGFCVLSLGGQSAGAKCRGDLQARLSGP
ncbi:unnamed protein product, partial [Prorocentrum cordatum]